MKIVRLLLLAAAASATGLASGQASSLPRKAPFCVLAVEEETGDLAIINPSNRSTKRIALDPRPHEIAVSADHRMAYVSEFGIADYDRRLGVPGDHVAVVDLTTGRVAGSLKLPAGLTGPHGVKLRPQSSEIYVNAEVGGDTMLVFDAGDKALKRRFPLPAGTHNFVFSRNGQAVYSFGGADGVSKLDARTGLRLAHQMDGAPFRGLFVTRRGTVLAGRANEVQELNPGDLSVLRRWKLNDAGQVAYLSELSDGTILAPALASGGVTWLTPGRPPRLVTTGKTALRASEGPDGLIYVANVEDDHISVLDRVGRRVGVLGPLTSPNGIEFGRCPAGG
jgi:DNA-binding beta-propeller fold protein YncE